MRALTMIIPGFLVGGVGSFIAWRHIGGWRGFRTPRILIPLLIALLGLVMSITASAMMREKVPGEVWVPNPSWMGTTVFVGLGLFMVGFLSGPPGPRFAMYDWCGSCSGSTRTCRGASRSRFRRRMRPCGAVWGWPRDCWPTRHFRMRWIRSWSSALATCTPAEWRVRCRRRGDRPPCDAARCSC